MTTEEKAIGTETGIETETEIGVTETVMTKEMIDQRVLEMTAVKLTEKEKETQRKEKGTRTILVPLLNQNPVLGGSTWIQMPTMEKRKKAETSENSSTWCESTAAPRLRGATR